MQKLKVLYMSHNYVRDWREFDHMSELPNLEDLVFVGNPLVSNIWKMFMVIPCDT